MARYLTKAELAAELQVGLRTIDSWHSRGLITAYRDDNRVLRFNLAAVELAMAMNPHKMRDGRRRGVAGKIVPMPVEAEGVEP